MFKDVEDEHSTEKQKKKKRTGDGKIEGGDILHTVCMMQEKVKEKGREIEWDRDREKSIEI